MRAKTQYRFNLTVVENWATGRMADAARIGIDAVAVATSCEYMKQFKFLTALGGPLLRNLESMPRISDTSPGEALAGFLH